MKKTIPGLGIALIILGAIGIIINFAYDSPRNLIWFCNHTSIILGIAFLCRSRFWITAQLNIALIPQLFWSIDFLGKLLFDTYIFGFTDYMFALHYESIFYYLSLNHLFITPIALYGLYKIGKPVWAWKGSLAHGFVLWIASQIFSDGLNLNCVIKPCTPYIPEPYLITIPIVYIAMIFLTNKLLLLVFKRNKRK